MWREFGLKNPERRSPSTTTRLFRTVIGTLSLGMALASVSALSLERAEGKASSPKGRVLAEPVSLKVVVEAPVAGTQVAELICPTNTYQGELNSKRGGVSLRMAISGTIGRLDQKRFLISYDLEVRIEDGTRKLRFSASGAGLLSNGKPMKIVTAAGKSVTMTATTIKRNPGFESTAREKESTALATTNGPGNGDRKRQADRRISMAPSGEGGVR